MANIYKCSVCQIYHRSNIYEKLSELRFSKRRVLRVNYPTSLHAMKYKKITVRPQGQRGAACSREVERVSRESGRSRRFSIRVDSMASSLPLARPAALYTLRQHVSAAAGARKFSPGDKIFQVVARSLSRAIVPR